MRDIGIPVLSSGAALSWISFALFGYAIIYAIDFQQRTLLKSRQLTEQFRRQQHFTDSVISAAPSLTYIYDTLSQTNVFISPQVEEILGYGLDEIAAMGSDVLPTLLHPEDMPRAAERFAALRQIMARRRPISNAG